ncbi:MAG: chemotaxis protein CheX [Candidatus Cloacimonetes bacterium]|nr:chemotaxis protein CheX [Candidatus Cloacimonadota bacterium]
MIADTDFSSFFVRGLKSVFKEYAIELDSQPEAKLHDNKYIETSGVDILIYLFEEIEGFCVLSFAVDVATNITRSIDMDPDSVDDQITREAMAEIGNLAAARASAFLAKSNVKTNISPPSVFWGKGSHIYSMVPNLTRTLFHTQYGVVTLFSSVRLRKK